MLITSGVLINYINNSSTLSYLLTTLVGICGFTSRQVNISFEVPFWEAVKRYLNDSKKSKEDKESLCSNPTCITHHPRWPRTTFNHTECLLIKLWNWKIIPISRVTVMTQTDVFWNAKSFPNINFHLYRQNRIKISIQIMGPHSLVNSLSWCFSFIVNHNGDWI